MLVNYAGNRFIEVYSCDKKSEVLINVDQISSIYVNEDGKTKINTTFGYILTDEKYHFLRERIFTEEN